MATVHTSPALPEVLTLEQTAALLGGVHVRTVHRWRRGPRPLPSCKKGRIVLFLKDDVLAWLRGQRETPSASTPRRLKVRRSPRRSA